jgi:hypothetical protein
MGATRDGRCFTAATGLFARAPQLAKGASLAFGLRFYVK